jgi:HK97 gp10 family phage protein
MKNFEIEGLDKLIKDCARLGDDAMPYLKEAADNGGEYVLAKTKEKVPVRTGELKRKLKLSKMSVKKGKYKIYSSVTFGKGVAYGVPLELGHKLVIKGKTVGTVKEKPYLRPAADESKEKVIDVITKAMNKALEDWGRR